jgi:hypothetical protein
MGFGSLVGVDEDGLDAQLARPVDIAVHIVTHADHLGRQQLNSVESFSDKPGIRFPESVIRGHLVFPGVRSQRPAVAEDDGLSCAPVLVVQFDVARVIFTNVDVIPWKSPYRSRTVSSREHTPRMI